MLGELVRAVKVRHLDVSEGSIDSLTGPNRSDPVMALQIEWSLWRCDVETGGAVAARELWVSIVSYAPLGRSLLSDDVRDVDQRDPTDPWRGAPRFQAAYFKRDLVPIVCIRHIARLSGGTPAQLALAWVLAQVGDLPPIPGTKRKTNLASSVAAASVHLTDRALAGLPRADPLVAAAGARYPATTMGALRT